MRLTGSNSKKPQTLRPVKTKVISCLLFSTFIALLFTACHDNNNPQPTDDSLFPLAVGNSWEYSPFPSNQSGYTGSVKSEITAIIEIENKEYYQMINKSEGTPNPYIDTVYYRVDNNGFVYKRRKSGEEGNPFRLQAQDGDKWKYSTVSTENDMSVIFQEPITISSTQVSDCRLFVYDVSGLADEESYTTLAPGIGIVTSHTAWGFRRDLKKAVISGITYHF